LNELKFAQREALKYVARRNKALGIKLSRKSSVRETIVPSTLEGIRLRAECDEALALAKRTHTKEATAKLHEAADKLRAYQARRVREVARNGQ
jgi:hypothetical protein